MKPTTPQAAAGWRTLPPASVPGAWSTMLRGDGDRRARRRPAGDALAVVGVAAGRPAGRLAHHPPGQLRHRELAQRDGAGGLVAAHDRSRSRPPVRRPRRHGAPPVVWRPATSKQSFQATPPASGPRSSPRASRLARPRERALAVHVESRTRRGRSALDRLERGGHPFADSPASCMAWDHRRPMVLSDVSIREEIAAGRIGLEPFDDALVQPSSVDVRCDHRFRVFHPGRYPYIDLRQAMPDLTELVEITDERAFILHPGEFVLGATVERLSSPTTWSRASTARARWAAWACRCTRRRAWPTPASAASSRSSCPTWRRCRSRSIPACASPSSSSSGSRRRPPGPTARGARLQVPGPDAVRPRASTGATFRGTSPVNPRHPSHPGGRELLCALRKGGGPSCEDITVWASGGARS